MSSIAHFNPIIPSFDKKLDDSRDLEVLFNEENRPVVEENEEVSSKKSLAQVLKDIINAVGGIKVAKHDSETTEYGAATNEMYGHMKPGVGLESDENTPGIINVKYGITAGTTCEGNDYRLSDARVIKNGLKMSNSSKNTDLLDGDIFDGSVEGKTLSYQSIGAAPKNHAINGSTYGLGTNNVFGHVKLSDTYDTIEENAGALNAIGASANALQNAFKENADSISSIFNILNREPELIYDKTYSVGYTEVFSLETNRWYIATYSSTDSNYNGICLGCSFSPGENGVPSFLFCVKGTMPINEVMGEQIPFLRIESGNFYRMDLRSSGSSTRVKLYKM